MMKFNVYFLFIVMIFSSFKGISQTKSEKETRIESKDFPKKALKLLENVPVKSKQIRFYKETDSEKISYEAKLKFNQKQYSIEFDNEGNLEDVEIIIKQKNLDDELLNTIKTYFKDHYVKFWILKIQKQYSKETSGTDEFILKKAIEDSDVAIINYEIIAQIQSKGSKEEFKEFTFNHIGILLKSRHIEPSSYEHVLY